MPMLASLNDARDYFEQLPAQLEVYFDEAYQRAFDRLISAFEQFFDVAETVNQQADDDHVISTTEATEIGEHGFILILQMIDYQRVVYDFKDKIFHGLTLKIQNHR